MHNLINILTALFILSSCVDRVICPAFQSSYILDDSTRMAYYSYVWKLDKTTRDKFIAENYSKPIVDSLSVNDSVAVGNSPEGMAPYYEYVAAFVQPAEQTNRTKYGIVKYEPMWLKNYKLRTAPMENLLGPEKEVEEIPEQIPIDVGDFVASDFGADSLTSDSAFTALDDSTTSQTLVTETQEGAKPEGPKYRYKYDPKDNFNYDQDYYNKYFGKRLLDNRPSPIEQDSLSSNQPEVFPEPSDSTQVKRKGMFKKSKDKNEEEPEGAVDDTIKSEEGNNEEGNGQ